MKLVLTPAPRALSSKEPLGLGKKARVSAHRHTSYLEDIDYLCRGSTRQPTANTAAFLLPVPLLPIHPRDYSQINLPKNPASIMLLFYSKSKMAPCYYRQTIIPASLTPGIVCTWYMVRAA